MAAKLSDVPRRGNLTAGTPRALDEEVNGRIFQQRLQLEDALSSDVERSSARGQESEVASSREQLGDARDCPEDMLEVVKDEESSAGSQTLRDSPDHVVGGHHHADNAGDSAEDGGRLRERREVDEVGA